MTEISKIPPNYQTVMPYLIVQDGEKFIAFVKQVFDATETYKAMRDVNTIMHAEVMIKESTIMFADSTNEYAPRTAGLFVYVDDADETYKKALEAGATKVTELSDQPYGRSGGVTDPFGNTWWITSII
jgi:PhnB protein